MRLHRIRNRILQLTYRPGRPLLLSGEKIKMFREMDEAIEKKITPLLSGLFKNNAK